MTRKKKPKPQTSGRSPSGSTNSSPSLRSSAKSPASVSPDLAAKQAPSMEVSSPPGDSTTQVFQLDSKQQAPDNSRSELPPSCTETEVAENQNNLPFPTELTDVEAQAKLQELSAATVETNYTATAQEHLLPLTQPVPDPNPPQAGMKIQASIWRDKVKAGTTPLPVANHEVVGCSSSQTPPYVRPPTTELEKAMLCVDLRTNLFDGVKKSKAQSSTSSASDSDPDPDCTSNDEDSLDEDRDRYITVISNRKKKLLKAATKAAERARGPLNL
ncbi:hypothetical protein Bca52824_069656 [Brassica carinata]|uniref:Uncharacterized protein n=1 Tax=Brassica carinata TaxID=52824 RepID=A0A8X7U1K7_BRACI|nr:hypothetical protein Bca52824_069656 [Brassica carinata]